MEEIVKEAKKVCPELVQIMRSRYPEYATKYVIYCAEYLDNVGKAQKMIAAQDILLTWAWLNFRKR